MKHLPRLFLLLPLGLPLGLAGCGSSAPPSPLSFPALNYSYLPPITLKVARIDVRDEYLPGPDAAQLISQDPEAPALALESMARSRLVADGSPGSATFVIRRASLHDVGGVLEGSMDVQVNISTSNGQRVAFAEAAVSRSVTAPPNDASPARLHAALYNLTKDLMTDMNVQFQYQVQKSLADWLAFPPNAYPSGNQGSNPASNFGPAAGSSFGTSSMMAPPINNSGNSSIEAQPLNAPSSSMAPLPQPDMQLVPSPPPQ
jgi:hypothetical protein